MNLNQTVNAATQWAWNCLIPSRLRRMVNSSVVTVDEEMKGKHPRAWAMVKELSQNFPLIDWAIAVDADFTSSFNFQARTPDRGFNTELEAWMIEKSERQNFDVAGRLDRDTMVRMFRALENWDGDSGILKCEGGQFQLLEAWQIAKGVNAPSEVNDFGMVLDSFSNKTLKYALCGKEGGQIKHQRLEAAENVIFDGNFVRPNSTRGVSRFLAAVDLANSLSDSTRYYIEQMRIASMLGIALFRGNDGTSNDFVKVGAGQSGKPKIKVEPLMLLDMKVGEEAKFLTNPNPAQQQQEFAKHISRLILSCLGIPYSAFDSAASNYAAMRADWTRYGSSTKHDRGRMKSNMNDITRHMVKNGIIAGDFKLPSKMDPKALKWEWISTAQFIIDKPAEVDALVNLIKAGITTRQQISKELGYGDWFETADALKAEQEVIKKNSLTIELTTPGAGSSQPGQGKQAAPKDEQQQIKDTANE